MNEPTQVEIDAESVRRVSEHEANAIVRVEELRLERAKTQWGSLRFIALVLVIGATCVAGAWP